MLRASSTASVAWATAPVQFPPERSASANRGNANRTSPIAPSLRAWVSMRLNKRRKPSSSPRWKVAIPRLVNRSVSERSCPRVTACRRETAAAARPSWFSWWNPVNRWVKHRARIESVLGSGREEFGGVEIGAVLFGQERGSGGGDHADLPGPLRVGGHHVPGGLVPDPDPHRHGTGNELDPAAEPIQIGPHHGVGGTGSGRGGQPHRPRQLRRQVGVGGRREKPGAAGLLVAGQLRGPFECRTGGLEATPGRRAPGGVVQRRNDLVVGFVDRRGEVPGPPVRVLTVGHHLGQRPVRLLPNIRCGALIDGGTNQRVTETDLGPGNRQQPRFLRLGQRGRADAEEFRGLPDHAHPGRVVGGRDTQQGLRGGGQSAAAVQEDPLHPLGQRQVRRQWFPHRRAGPV